MRVRCDQNLFDSRPVADDGNRVSFSESWDCLLREKIFS